MTRHADRPRKRGGGWRDTRRRPAAPCGTERDLLTGPTGPGRFRSARSSRYLPVALLLLGAGGPMTRSRSGRYDVWARARPDLVLDGDVHPADAGRGAAGGRRRPRRGRCPTARRYGYLLDDDEHALPDPALATPAGRRARAVGRPSTPPAYQLAATRPGPGAELARRRHLRAARRHLHAGGDARRRGRASLDYLVGSRRGLRGAAARQRASTGRTTGATTACCGTPCTRRTAARRRTSASWTPAHAAGLGVIQDVVYNHLGPSGNYLPQFGPYLKQGDAQHLGRLRQPRR